MKKFCFLLSFVLFAGIASAQTCNKSKKSCAKKCSKTAKTATTDAQTKVASSLASADAVALQDETIEKKVCAKSGNVSFYKNTVCAKSGNTMKSEVIFNEVEGVFVDAAEASTDTAVKSASAEGKAKKQCSKSCAKKCSKGAKKKGA